VLVNKSISGPELWVKTHVVWPAIIEWKV